MNNTELAARYSAIQDELAQAPNHKVGSDWWNDRIEELQGLAKKLGRSD
ncbi:MAG: hypothetical protein JO295_03695 [Verrucomicrobia bacterium]|nr:hypothetical protein [Verrucomicrobiota bacterium]